MAKVKKKAKTYSVKISQQAKHELELFCAHYGRSQTEFVSELILNYTRPDESANISKNTVLDAVLDAVHAWNRRDY